MHLTGTPVEIYMQPLQYYFYMQAEVLGRVRAVRRPPPPSRRPREGSGGNGGAHN